MSYYKKLKWKNEILSVAEELGFKGEKSGTSYIGNCPDNGNQFEKCLTIWPNTQKFYCSHCQKSGDVINLVMLFKKLDFKQSILYLTERVEIPYLGYQKLTTNELERLEAKYQENALVENMLTQAAIWFHNQLENYPDIKDHLLSHYRFSESAIKEFQIGFAPPQTGDTSSRLAEYLNTFPGYQGKLALTGLFNFESPEGPYSDFFNGRIIFPYWKCGKVIYMAGMATEHTLVNQHECYIDKDENIKKDGHGNPEYIKYKKLQTFDPNYPQREHISIFIQNDSLMGEDTIRNAKEVIITKDAPDFITALDHGFAAISTATDQFLEEDFEKLKNMTGGIPVIYLINDNEDTQTGLDGNKTAGTFLTLAGKNIYPVVLLNEENTKRINLYEYFKDHKLYDFPNLLMEKKECLFQKMIEELPPHPLKALHKIHSFIAPILAEHEGISLDYHVGGISDRTKINAATIYNEVQSAKNKKAINELKREKLNIDPEIRELVTELSQDPLLYKKRIDTINEAGVVGERKAISMYFAALDSRLLVSEDNSVLAVKNSGHFGAGKSYTLDKCLKIYPKTTYRFITSGSKKSIIYLGKDELKHKTLVFAEGLQLQTNQKDSELLYTIRSLLSEGRVKYEVAEMARGGRQTNEIKLNGPTSFITTTIIDKLEDQLEDRLFTIHPDETNKQTKGIIEMEGKKRAGKIEGLDRKTIETWKVFHDSLSPVKIVIPFAEKVSDFLNQHKTLPLSSRRAFKRVMSVIETVACLHQHQRERDKQNRIIADISDYWMALQIIREAFMENIEQQNKETRDRIKDVEENAPVKMKTLVEKWKISDQAVSSWVKKQKGIVAWCDENGDVFEDDQEANKSKSSGRAFLNVVKDCIVGLPTPYNLKTDPKWKKGGEFYEKFYLNLHTRKIFEEGSNESDDVNQEPTQIPEATQSGTPSKSDSVKSDQLKEKVQEVAN